MDSLHKWVLLSACIMGIIYVLWNITEDEEEEKDYKKQLTESDPFIPTHEWQEVKPTQAIPPVGRKMCIFHL